MDQVGAPSAVSHDRRIPLLVDDVISAIDAERRSQSE